MNEGSEQEVVKRKQFAMYNFEILAEYHLSQELIVENSKDFITLFSNSLEDPHILIKVASLKAISSFLSSIDDEDVVLKYKSLTDKLLSVVIEVMKLETENLKRELVNLLLKLLVHALNLCQEH